MSDQPKTLFLQLLSRIRFPACVVKVMVLLAFLFLPFSKAAAQNIYVTDASGNVFMVNLANCTSTLVAPTTGITWYDMAICSNNPNIMYAIDGNNTLYMINLVTGVTTFLNGSFNSTFPNFSLLNSLVCDGNGNLYAADAFNSGLYSYNIATGTWTFTGLLGGYGSGGDLTFYNGNLYLATGTNDLLEISLSPFGVVSTNLLSAAGVYGILTTSTSSLCTTGVTSMLAMSGSDVYTVNPATGTCVIQCPAVIPGVIYGAASIFEGTIPPNVTLTVAASDTTLCAGQTATLTATGAGNTGTYDWQPGNLSGSSVIVSPAVSTTYSVIATDTSGCSDTGYVTINVSPGLQLGGTSQNATCFGACDGTASATIVSGNGPYVYAWSPSGATTASDTLLCAGAVSVFVTDAGGCTDTQTFTITEPAGMTSTTTIVHDSCFGNCNGAATLAIAGGSGVYTYAWSPSGGNASAATNLCAGNYVALVTDSAGCAMNFSITITQPALLTLTMGNTLNSCIGSSATLSATPNGGTGQYVYAWQPGNLSAASPLVTPATTTIYSLTITDANGCTTTGTQTVNANPVPVVSFIASDSSGCAPLCVTFTSPTQAGDVCQWNFGDGNNSSGNSPQNHCYNLPGTYDVTLTVTDNNGCSATITEPDLINVFAIPFASFNFSPDFITIYDPSVSFIDNSIGAAQWSWNFGDVANSVSTLQNPNFAYGDTGCFAVTLTVTNPDGCTDDSTQDVCIVSEFIFYAPNTFTPNGNGLNDVFLPVVNGYEQGSFHMMIFDRWGNLIFESDDVLTGWNGKVQYGKSDAICQVDTYVWVVNVDEWNGVKHQYRGHVNLIR
ncbi:MAG: PKD domain-containing protein [Bacteroidota bacterium]|nr:PKD domain-containing protein [Bacteroidota bacterium]